MWESIKEFGQSIVDFLYEGLVTIMTFIGDVFFVVMESLMTGAIAIMGELGEGLGSLNPTQYISAIPAETQGMMAAVGFNEALAIIVTALGIRMIIQLIPFIRWGS